MPKSSVYLLLAGLGCASSLLPATGLNRQIMKMVETSLVVAEGG